MEEMRPLALVTTKEKFSTKAVRIAKETAEQLGLPYVPRSSFSLPELREKYGVDNILVVKKGLLFLEGIEETLQFHPNMAHIRVKNLRFGRGDHLVKALDIQPGDRILDCTLGLGADAIVESFAAGPEGSVTGLESRPLIEAVVSYGLRHFDGDGEKITEAMRRVQTVCTDALAYLKEQPDNSFDAIYFDPMFRYPLMDSENLSPLRALADDRALTEETVAEACRVAKRRVVMKENARSLEFERLGFKTIMGGKYSKVHYGVMIL
ncbi:MULTISPECIES: class I SAM-dependent methyltransferase [unclassified Selenomonas]|uniref:class I SAM-dependent methyltransferase n=1 Tax=unclassified Selenomonas TaxID=2637378 RepID=UPI0004966406|nr:Putative SAM-dependent methyltransferase [Selenomonas ruminantium]